MPFEIVHNDITKMKTDAVVNAANRNLLAGGGVCGAIFRAAGETELQKECNKKAPCETGNAVITGAYNLDAKYIIHAVGPVWRGGRYNEEAQLKSAYIKSLEIAYKYKCKSISFPLISAGIYGYPKDKALSTAISAITEFLLNYDMYVYLVVLDKKSVELSKNLFHDLKNYIDSYFVEDIEARRSEIKIYNYDKIGKLIDFDDEIISRRTLKNIVNNMNETFSQMLLRLIDEKGYTDVEVYKRANMDRRLFSKIRSSKDYIPKKKNVISLAVALRLSLDETMDFLMKAGYSLSDSQKSDVIIRFFIENNEYDIHKINQALFYFDQPVLGE